MKPGFRFAHTLLILVVSCFAVFCRVVLRFFPIVLSFVESQITVSLGFRLVRVDCSPESCSSPCRVQVSPTRCNRGCWPLSGPSGVAATVRVDARFQGTIVRELRLPLLSPEFLRTQTAVRHRRVPVSILRSSCKCLEVVSISLFSISKTIVTTYLNAGRTFPLFHRCAVARLYGFTVT